MPNCHLDIFIPHLNWNNGLFHHYGSGDTTYILTCHLARSSTHLLMGDKHLSDTQKRLVVTFYFPFVFRTDDG